MAWQKNVNTDISDSAEKWARLSDPIDQRLALTAKTVEAEENLPVLFGFSEGESSAPDSTVETVLNNKIELPLTGWSVGDRLVLRVGGLVMGVDGDPNLTLRLKITPDGGSAVEASKVVLTDVDEEHFWLSETTLMVLSSEDGVTAVGLTEVSAQHAGGTVQQHSSVVVDDVAAAVLSVTVDWGTAHEDNTFFLSYLGYSIQRTSTDAANSSPAGFSDGGLV